MDIRAGLCQHACTPPPFTSFPDSVPVVTVAGLGVGGFAAFGGRPGKCVDRMNAEYDLDGLCRRFPERLRKLEANKGERLRS